jgi:hypothetical protein
MKCFERTLYLVTSQEVGIKSEIYDKLTPENYDKVAVIRETCEKGKVILSRETMTRWRLSEKLVKKAR